ncbi:iron-siderophore ABC transporter substrate-binding protein [Corynebacterium sp. ES2794-CONJ1]|uniref:iron-siderophore ABC transporter substrate-binding protein n=1 Tax=unclassified Corynebacterium TaxID=2624378 RepID=UPI00216A0F31|nr:MULTISPECIES: iron-siderophore ABC transporter substrate-binding protein [unclassified Corynebacterium]MCS4489631.1 iron-siderophore ABC transporter substrate-binding protein [Corynebacterium sp. ES2775-CONJ]MCS4491360.1 iron-siderophore ABC transporter substrate-binding protein [Corynebacterium sp. ES2715-CONJ3]MCS4531542.1 iron-siderophore ABC transporter substrate-binding protein [Corynebacterium sp. ES2730-CONJ]MCU9518939.1 iron-siderophore ABC transporter substrate-binding protein [Cory
MNALPSMLRPHLLAGLAALLIPGLVACSSQDVPQDTQSSNRTITDIDGQNVVVPLSPQRVVALSEPTLDNLLALGITPVGAVAGRGQATLPNYLIEIAGDVPLLGNVAQPNFEAIATAQPDIIFVDGTSINNNPPVIAALNKIAPVVYTGWAGGDWRDNLRITADAMNLSDEGEKLITAYDKKTEKVSKELDAYADSTFSVVRWQGNSASMILKELPAGRALEDVGLRRPPNQDREGRGHSDPVSLENLHDIDADYIFFGTLGGSAVNNPQAGGSAGVEEAVKAITAAKDIPGFSALEAFQQDHIIPVDGSVWTSAGGPILMNRLIDDIVEKLV